MNLRNADCQKMNWIILLIIVTSDVEISGSGIKSNIRGSFKGPCIPFSPCCCGDWCWKFKNVHRFY